MGVDNYWADIHKRDREYPQLKRELPILRAELDKLRAENSDLREQVKKWRRIRIPTHGSCCACQQCGQHYDECRCDLDEVADDLQLAQSRVKELEAFVEAVAHMDVTWPEKYVAEARRLTGRE